MDETNTNNATDDAEAAKDEANSSPNDTHRVPTKKPKKKSKKGAKSPADGDTVQSDIVAAGSSTGPASSAQGSSALEERLRELVLAPQRTAAKDMSEAKKKQYLFWETQPVPKFDDDVSELNEEIEKDREAAEIREEPYSLPQGFYWVSVSLHDETEVNEVYVLLSENYVEDDDNMFRFDYSPAFLQWALQPPGWLPQWHVGVRACKTGKLLAFISAVPCTIRVYDKIRTMVEINFLCVHKKLRSKRVAPVLIREITRRVNQQGIFQAVFTAGIVIPRPITTCRYWHRSLNPKKLIDVKFSYLQKNMTMQRTLKFYKLPEEPKTPGFRQLRVSDVPQAYRLLTDYLKSFDLVPIFSVEEFQHFFVPRTDVIDSYVVETNGELTDLVSFYTLPSTVMHHPTYKNIKAAYSFYNVATSTTWTQLMQDALIVAHKNGYDVFNALDLMENSSFLQALKFGIGDGNLQYYLYNWKCSEMPARKSSPLLLQCSSAIMQSDAECSSSDGQLKLHYMVHSSLDVVDEKLSQPSGGAGRSTDLRELYLGMLYSNEQYKTYGYATNTKIKFVIVVELGNPALKDQEMRALFKRLHSVYCDAVASPFYVPGTPINNSALLSTVNEILKV